MPTIGIATASASIGISAAPAFAISPNASAVSSSVFSPVADNLALIDVLGSTFVPRATTGTQSSAIGGVVFQQSVNISVGSQTNSLVPQLLNAFQYKFDNFTLINSSSFEYGDVVFFKSGSNEYSATLEKADVTSTASGAYNTLFIFQEYTNSTLQVMHKGYIDLPASKINTWTVGQTLYLDANSKLNSVPTAGSSHWIRSLGFCIPNNQNKKTIWFEPDSTYLKLI